MTRSVIIIVSIYLLALSCSSNKSRHKEEGEFAEILFDNKETDRQTTEFFELIDSIFVVDLQVENNFLLGSISRVHLTEDRIYVSDNTNAKVLYVYDRQGNPLFQVGRQGRGPGEYIGIRDFIITAEHIILFDDSNAYLLVYNKEGKFQYKWETDAYDVGMIDDRTLVEHDGAGTLTVKNLEGEDLRSFSLNFQGIEAVDGACFSTWNDRLSFIDLINQRVYRISPDSIVPYAFLNLGSWQLPLNYYKSFQGEAPQNMYLNVYQKTSFETNFGLFADYQENASWEYYRFTVKMLPRSVYRHKASGKTLLLEWPLSKNNIDAGFLSLGVGGSIAAVNDFFVISTNPGKISDFLETDQIKNPMLLRLQERVRSMNISLDSNPLLLFYRLK